MTFMKQQGSRKCVLLFFEGERQKGSYEETIQVREKKKKKKKGGTIKTKQDSGRKVEGIRETIWIRFCHGQRGECRRRRKKKKGGGGVKKRIIRKKRTVRGECQRKKARQKELIKYAIVFLLLKKQTLTVDTQTICSFVICALTT